MSDEKTHRQRWEEDGTICPFCGNEEYASPCDHMLASFATDLSDGDGGVLGEGWVASVVREPALELGRACRDLLEAVWRDDEHFEARPAKLRAMTKDDPAAWWDWVVDGIANNDACSDDDVGLGYFATPIVCEVVKGVPGVLVSEVILGGMTSSSVCFLWSHDPETGTEALRVRIAKATEAVRKVIAAIG